VGEKFDDFVMLCIQVAEYLLEHQWMFIRHILVPNPSDGIRCANRLSCRFVDARYNLNCTTALLTGFNVYVKNPFKSLCPGHRLVFLYPCFFLPCRQCLFSFISFCWCYCHAVPTVWWRATPREPPHKYAMRPTEVYAGFGYQGR
jgi:hypothetical protein